MIKAGQILLAVGFLSAAAAAVIEKEAVLWFYFAAGMAIAAAGVTMAQLGLRQKATTAEVLSNNIGAIEKNLSAICRHAETLSRDREKIFVYDFHQKIDEIFPPHLEAFVTARESLIHVYSMNDYAHIMNHFAAGERSLNRVWSASVDGYEDEVRLCIEKANRHFQEALHEFKRVQEAA